MSREDDAPDNPAGEQRTALGAGASAGDAIPEGWSAFRLRQAGDALTDASDLLTRHAVDLHTVDAVVSEQIQREGNAIGQRGIRYKFAADDAELHSCPTCFHPSHEGRCQDSDDIGLPWDRPCDCEGPNPAAGAEHGVDG